MASCVQAQNGQQPTSTAEVMDSSRGGCTPERPSRTARDAPQSCSTDESPSWWASLPGTLLPKSFGGLPSSWDKVMPPLTPAPSRAAASSLCSLSWQASRGPLSATSPGLQHPAPCQALVPHSSSPTPSEDTSRPLVFASCNLTTVLGLPSQDKLAGGSTTPPRRTHTLPEEGI